MIALALACNPSLILADEPTSSLDVTVQRDILALMKELSAVSRTAVLFITHDLVLVGQTCDELVVMYAGTVVERGPSEAVLRLKHHPYTRALIAAIPTIDARKTTLDEIEGSVPSLIPRPGGCPFAPRCTSRIPGTCDLKTPVERVVADGVRVRCHLYESAA
jgi:peptide/nickel transport system ATP-binding protein